MTNDLPRQQASPRPTFDAPVPASGYRWWYVDGISADGRNGIVVIAFVGSVFSPYYYRARAQGKADPLNYCAINVGLYRNRGKRWAMTERGRAALTREADCFRVGPSRLEWRDDGLVIEIRERSAPLGLPLAGRIVLRPAFTNDTAFLLDDTGRHSWQPLAPSATIAVDFERPAVRWQGDGYFDTNAGSRALEADFRHWNWSRGRHGDATTITYAVTALTGVQRALTLDFDADGRLCSLPAPPAAALPGTGWRIRRETRAGAPLRLLRTLEDTPFYARSLLEVGSGSESGLVMHESLDLERFRSGWVRLLLPFRMPRLATRS